MQRRTTFASLNYKSQANRQSGVGRGRHSVYGGKGMAADPRPLKERHWVLQCTRDLIDFLMQHGYEASPLSVQLLSPPASKTTHFITEFLFRQIDPGFQVEKFEEQFGFFLLKLGYPVKVPRSAALSPGTPHAWPHILAAFHWVVELLRYTERLDDPSSKDDEGKGAGDAGGAGEAKQPGSDPRDKNKQEEYEFLDWLATKYSQWLRGSIEGEAVDEAVKERFGEETEALNAAVADYERANTQLRTEIERVRTENPPIGELQDERQKLLADDREFETWIEELHQNKSDLQQTILGKEQDVQELRDKVKEYEEKSKQVQATLAKQTISPQDVERMREQQRKLETAVKENADRLAQLKKEVYSGNHELKSKFRRLQALVKQFNRLGEAVEIIPPTAKFACGHDYRLVISEECFSEVKDLDDAGTVELSRAVSLSAAVGQRPWINADLRQFQTHLANLAEMHNKAFTHAKDNALCAKRELEEVLHAVQQERSAVRNLEKRCAQFEEECRKLREKKAKLNHDIVDIENRELQTKHRRPSDEADAKKQLQVTLKRHKQRIRGRRREMAEETRSVASAVKDAIQCALTHRKKTRKELKAAARNLERCKEKMSYCHVEPTLDTLHTLHSMASFDSLSAAADAGIDAMDVDT